jgi:DNA primase
MIDLDTLRRDNPLAEVAARVVALRTAGAEWVACCPFHADRSPSFTIYDAGRRFHCFGCGAGGDVLDFVQRAYAVTLPEAARMLGAGTVPRLALPAAPPFSNGRKADFAQSARAIWHRSEPLSGTVAEAYLHWRGVAPPYPPSLRFARLPWADLGPLPCLVAAVQDVAGEVTGIQRIWLAEDGRGKAAVPKPKLSLGTIKGGAIRLGDLDGSGGLTVCEGPEDGLSLALMLGGPVWVAAGASFLPAMRFPPQVRAIVIGADNDPAGREAADKAARAFARRGLSVRIIRPLEGFKDFNDELQGGRDNGH